MSVSAPPGRPNSTIERTRPITWARLATASPYSVSSCGVILRSPPQLPQCEEDEKAAVRYKLQESMRTVCQVPSADQGKREVVDEPLLWRTALWQIRMKHEGDSGSTPQTPSKAWLENVSRWRFFYVSGAPDFLLEARISLSL